jgi:hypothetical protein
MNIREYKKAMDEISVNTNTIKDKVKDSVRNEKYLALRYKKIILACITAIAILLVPTVSRILNVESIPDITLTVLANSGEAETLSDEPVVLTPYYQENMLQYSKFDNGLKKGSINFNLNFQCEGETIKEITYKLSDQTITRENRNEFTAWFAENQIYNSSSDAQNNKDKTTYRIVGDFKNQRHEVTKMIGSYYTVSYGNQNSKQYALEINLTQDETGKLNCEKFTINVIIVLEDESTIEKQIVVQPFITETSDDTSCEIKMHLLN